MSDEYKIRIKVERPCCACNGTGWMPDPNILYRARYGSTVPCKKCGSSGWAASKSLTLLELYDLMHGWRSKLTEE